jgi:hypothetical protein
MIERSLAKDTKLSDDKADILWRQTNHHLEALDRRLKAVERRLWALKVMTVCNAFFLVLLWVLILVLIKRLP